MTSTQLIKNAAIDAVTSLCSAHNIQVDIPERPVNPPERTEITHAQIIAKIAELVSDEDEIDDIVADVQGRTEIVGLMVRHALAGDCLESGTLLRHMIDELLLARAEEVLAR